MQQFKSSNNVIIRFAKTLYKSRNSLLMLICALLFCSTFKGRNNIKRNSTFGGVQREQRVVVEMQLFFCRLWCEWLAFMLLEPSRFETTSLLKLSSPWLREQESRLVILFKVELVLMQHRIAFISASVKMMQQLTSTLRTWTASSKLTNATFPFETFKVSIFVGWERLRPGCYENLCS